MSKKWTEEELGTLEEMACLYSVKQIAHRLKIRGYIRTEEAIAKRLNCLGYSTRPILDNYSCNEIAKVLCVHSSTVAAWVQRGWLKAARRSPKQYQVRSQDLKRFLSNPPRRIQKRIIALNKDAVEYLVGKIA